MHITSVIDAKEKRDVATLDLPNAFMQTKLGDEHVIMKLRGEVTELMVRVAPDTRSDYVKYENGAPILCVELLKALCRLLKSALKFYIKAVYDLKEEGFELNPCDGYSANKLVYGKC